MINFLELPQLKINTNNNFDIVIAGGRKPDSAWLKEIAKNRNIYCADKGIEAAFDNYLIPKLLIGDCDSTDKSFYEKAKNVGTNIDVHPIAKDDTDLQLLIQSLPAKNYIFTGIWGGRFDHLYANVFSILDYKLQKYNQVIMADEKEVMFFVKSDEDFKIELKKNPKAISILPLSEKTKVSIKNVRWELDNSELTMLKPYAISNEAIGDEISFQCFTGCCGLYIIFN